MDAKAEKIALFRYGLIAPLVLESLPRGELTRRAQEIAARHYEIPHSERTSVSVDTLAGVGAPLPQGRLRSPGAPSRGRIADSPAPSRRNSPI